MRFKALNTTEEVRSESNHESRELRQSQNAKDYRLALDLRREKEIGGQNWIVARTLLTRVIERSADASDDLSRRLQYLCERNLGDMLRLEGKKEDALRCFVRAAELDARDVVLWEEIGRLACVNGKMKLARHAFREGLRRSPNHWGCLSQLATVEIVLNRKDEASKTISQMTKLRSLSSLSLARLRKRRLLHVDNMQVKKRGRFFDFDSMEGNVLRLSECNANALGLLLLNALHASDENRIVSVCVVPSSSTMTTSNSSSYRNTNHGDDNNVRSSDVRKHILNQYLHRLRHERDTGLKYSSFHPKSTQKTSSSIHIHGYRIEDLTGDALLGHDIAFIDSSTGVWEEGTVFRYDRKKKSHLILISKDTNVFTTLDPLDYKRLWRFASDASLEEKEDEESTDKDAKEEEEEEEEEGGEDDDQGNSKRKRRSRRTETIRRRESVEHFQFDFEQEIEFLFSKVMDRFDYSSCASSSSSTCPSPALFASSTSSPLPSDKTVSTKELVKTPNQVMSFVNQHLSSAKPLRTIISMYFDWIFENLKSKEIFGQSYICSTRFGRPYKELTDHFERSGFKKTVFSSTSSSVLLPVSVLLDTVTLLYERNINLEIQDATRLSLASLCCSSSTSQAHIAMSWRLLSQCPQEEQDEQYQARVYLLRGKLHQRAGHVKDSLRALEFALKFSKNLSLPSLSFEIERKIQELNITRIIEQVKTYASIFHDASVDKSKRERAAKNTINVILKTFESPFQNHSYLYTLFERDVSMLTSLSWAFEIYDTRKDEVVTFISECIVLFLALGNNSNNFLRQVLPTLSRVVARHQEVSVNSNIILQRALISISSFIAQDWALMLNDGDAHIKSLAEICKFTRHSFLDIIVPPLIASFNSNTTSSAKISWCLTRKSLLAKLFRRDLLFGVKELNTVRMTQDFAARLCVSLLPQLKTNCHVITCMIHVFAQMCLSRAALSQNDNNRVTFCLISTNSMLELIEYLSSEFFKTSTCQDIIRELNLEITRIILSWIESRRDKICEPNVSNLLVSKCFEYQYGIRLHDSIPEIPSSLCSAASFEKNEETNRNLKIHADDVNFMTQMIRNRLDFASTKYLQLGLELVLNHVGMPSRRNRLLDSVLASSTTLPDFFGEVENDIEKYSEDEKMMHEIYYEYLSIIPAIEFQRNKGETVLESVTKHWNKVKHNLELCMADLYYHKMRVETWYFLGCVLYDVIFVWCDQWNVIRKDSAENNEEKSCDDNDLIVQFGDLPRAFEYAERCFHLCIEMKTRFKNIDVDLRQCYERVALISMYRETQLSSILSLGVSFSEDHKPCSSTTISNFKTALNLATTNKSSEVDMSTVHLRILLSDLLEDKKNIRTTLKERFELLQEAVRMSQGNQEYAADAQCTFHALRARTVLEHLNIHNDETEEILCILEGENRASTGSFTTRKFNIVSQCVSAFEKIRKLNPYHHKATYELARTLQDGESLADAQRREVATVWVCKCANGVAYRARHGDFSSRILKPAGPCFNERVVAMERRGDWIRIHSNTSSSNSDERWLPLRHDKIGNLFVPAMDVYSGTDRSIFGTRQAKRVMSSLFSKKLIQIVAVWIKGVAKTSLELLQQRTKTFDETRTKYLTYFGNLCTLVRDTETMEVLCDRIRSNKTLSEDLKIHWTFTLLSGVCKNFHRDLEDLKGKMLSQSQQQIKTNSMEFNQTYSTLLNRAYKYHIMSEILPNEMRERTENVMIELYTNCTNMHFGNDASAFQLDLMLPPTWVSIQKSAEKMRVHINQLFNVTLSSSDLRVLSATMSSLVKSISDTLRPSNCITLREELDLMVRAARCTPLNAWMALSHCADTMTWAREKWNVFISSNQSHEVDLIPLSWITALDNIRRFRFRFVLNACAITWPQLQRHSVLKKKKKKKRKRRKNTSNTA